MSDWNGRFRGVLACWDIDLRATADTEAWELRIITVSSGITWVKKGTRMASVMEKHLNELGVRFIYRCNSLCVPHGSDIFKLRRVTEAAYLLGAGQ